MSSSLLRFNRLLKATRFVQAQPRRFGGSTPEDLNPVEHPMNVKGKIPNITAADAILPMGWDEVPKTHSDAKQHVIYAALTVSVITAAAIVAHQLPADEDALLHYLEKEPELVERLSKNAMVNGAIACYTASPNKYEIFIPQMNEKEIAYFTEGKMTPEKAELYRKFCAMAIKENLAEITASDL